MQTTTTLARLAIGAVLIAWFMVVSGDRGTLHAQASLTIENQVLKISVFADKGGLNEIIHKTSGINLRTRTAGAFRVIWSMNLTLADGTDVSLDNNRTTSFTGSVKSVGGNPSLDLTWQGLRPDGRDPIPNAVVHATVTLNGADGAATCRWEVQNLGGLIVQDVTYPYLTGIGPLGGADDVFIVPFQEGRLYRNPVANNLSFSNIYPSGSMNMQFMALSSPAVTFEVRTQDPSGYTKEFRFNRTTSPAADHTIKVQHDFDRAAVDRVSVPYDVIMTMFANANGDWTDAADDYRKWALAQTWAQQARVRSTPAWLLNTGVSRTLCAAGCPFLPAQTYQQDAAIVVQDQKSLGVASLLGWLQGWEKYGAWYYGDYFPPSGVGRLRRGHSGGEATRESMARVHQSELSNDGHRFVEIREPATLGHPGRDRQRRRSTGRRHRPDLAVDGSLHRGVADAHRQRGDRARAARRRSDSTRWLSVESPAGLFQPRARSSRRQGRQLADPGMGQISAGRQDRGPDGEGGCRALR